MKIITINVNGLEFYKTVEDQDLNYELIELNKSTEIFEIGVKDKLELIGSDAVCFEFIHTTK